MAEINTTGHSLEYLDSTNTELPTIYSIQIRRLEFQSNPPPPLPLPHLKHHLHAHKQHPTRRGQKPQSAPRAHHGGNHALQPVYPERKPHQIRGHHHEDIAHRPNATEHTIQVWSIPPLFRGERDGSQDLREDEEGDEPSPHEEAEIDIVP